MKRLFGFAMISLIGSALFVTNGLHLEDSILKRVETSSDVFRDKCKMCKLGISLFRYLVEIGENEEHILKIVSTICIVMNLSTPAVCTAGAHSIGEEVIEIAKRVKISSADICYSLLGEVCEEAVGHSWNITLPTIPKPPLKSVPLPNDNVSKLKILHLTDTHFDPYYLVGSNADCPEPMCCRDSGGLRNLSFTAAGKWGSFKCDVPKRMLEHLLDFISQTHNDIDYVIWTGDLASHDIWNMTNDKLMQAIEESIQLVSDKLPGVQVFPAIGNHERVPVNSFPTVEQDSSIAAYYNDIDRLWRRWLPASTSETIRRGAFYSVAVRPGLRIISLNMNVCYKFNFWLMQNSTDPISQLQWLINELQMAETANEKVHIIGHIPPGSGDCLKMWSWNYYEIVARYENTIAAQFFGHTHHDEIELFYDPNNSRRVTNIAYVCPSVTPFSYGNPAIRFYYIDGDRNDTTRLVLDHETWNLNLVEANLLDNPVWRESYSARDAYSMRGLRPVDWNDSIARMAKDDELFGVYFKNYWADSPFRPQCSLECKQKILCQAKSGRSHDKSNLCQERDNDTEKSSKGSSNVHHLNILLA